MMARQQGPAQDAPRAEEGVGRDRDGFGRDEQDREEEDRRRGGCRRHRVDVTTAASLLMTTHLFALGRPHFSEFAYVVFSARKLPRCEVQVRSCLD